MFLLLYIYILHFDYFADAVFLLVHQEDAYIYPDMAAYHSIAVTLGQAGLVKDLMKIIELMKQKPSKKIKNFRHKNWNPVLEPDLVVYNAVRHHLYLPHSILQKRQKQVSFLGLMIQVLNACVPSHQWKGAYWVFEQIRKSGLKPNGATYGLAMEVIDSKCSTYGPFIPFLEA